jgi:MFS family permease
MTRSRTPLLTLLAANAISLTGNALTWVALPWFVYEITGSAARTGIIGAVTGIATVLAAFAGAPFVDRFGHKRTSILADLLSGASVLAIPLLHASVGIAFWQLLLLAFLGAFLDAPGATARDALLPDAINAARTTPERANSAYQTVSYGAEVLGPLLAGGLIAVAGASNVLLVDAATFALSALAVALFVPSPSSEVADREERTYLADVVTGLHFIVQRPLLRVLAIASFLANFIGAPLFTVVLLVIVEEEYGSASVLGLLIAAGGVGLVAGSVLFGAIGHRLPRRATLVVGYSMFGLQMWVVALTPPAAIVAVVFAVRGFLTAPYNPITMTLFQERTPPDLRGRVFGANTALSLAGMPLGFLAGGLLVERVGAIETLLVMGVCYTVATLWLLVTPALRGMEANARP